MPLSRASCGRGEGDTLAIEQDIALLIAEDTGDRLDDGRLAGPVVAGERHDFARENIERDPVEGLNAAEMLGDIPDREDGRTGHSTWRPPMKRRWAWSTSTETMMTVPTAINCQKGSTSTNTSP